MMMMMSNTYYHIIQYSTVILLRIIIEIASLHHFFFVSIVVAAVVSIITPGTSVHRPDSMGRVQQSPAAELTHVPLGVRAYLGSVEHYHIQRKCTT